MRRYAGLEGPSNCHACEALPEHMQYSDQNYQVTTDARLAEYGGGSILVDEFGRRSAEDIKDLTQVQPVGYFMGKMEYWC